MSTLPFGNTEKLAITAYSNSKRSSASGKVGVFEAMFNPDSVRRRFVNQFRGQQGLNSAGRPAYFAYARPEEIELTILIDGSTMAAAMSRPAMSLFAKAIPVDVREKVEQFRGLAFTINGSIHQPNYLKLSMGSALEEVACRLASYTLEYSNFDDKGNPRRAEIQASFLTEMEAAKQNALTALESSDLTHRRTMHSGDTLPIMSKRIYGSSAHYLQLARFNDLDHFRQLPAGKHLIFPPLDDQND